MEDIYSFLDRHSIGYEKCEHPAVYTCEEAERLVPDLPGSHTKNLLLKDKKGKRYFLVVVGYDKSVDLKALAAMLEVKGLSFASPEKLMLYLGVEPGAATLLGLIADTEQIVEVIFDVAIAEADALQCHPLVNTATLVISQEDICRFLQETGHEKRVLEVPDRH